jgi:CHAT domain-containing protein/Tfp pilus assembly protein PilF
MRGTTTREPGERGERLAGRRLAGVLLLLGAAVVPAETSCHRPPAPGAKAPSGPSVRSFGALTGVPPEPRLLAAGERHEYELDLAAGEVARVIAEQHGVDIALTLADPAGRTVIRVDRPIGAAGAERITALAAAGGLHRLEVGHAGSGEPGRYLLRLVEGPRLAEAADRLRAEAEQTFHSARGSERLATAEGLAAAAEGYERALRLWTQAGDRHGQAIGGAGLGQLSLNLERWTEAAGHLDAALPLLIAEGELGPAAEAHNSQGVLSRRAGRFDEAAAYYEQALALAGPAGNEPARLQALYNRGLLFTQRGELEAALTDLEAARAGWRGLGAWSDEVGTLQRLAVVYLEAGEADLAEAPLEEALARAEQHGLAAVAAQVRALLARVAVLRQDLEQGEELLTRAIEVFTDLGLAGDLARALNELGQVYHLQGRYPEALTAFEEARSLFTAPRDLAMMRMHVAWSLEAMGRAERALAIYPELLVEFQRLGEPDLEASVHYGWALAELAVGRLDPALAHVERAIAQVERRLDRFSDRSLIAAYRARKGSYYALEVEILMRLHERDPTAGNDARAVTASERGRARRLLESLAATGGGPPPTLAPDLAAQRERLRRRLLGLELARSEAQAEASGHEPTFAAGSRLLRSELERLESRIVAADPRYAALVEPPAFDLERFRSGIETGTEVLVVSLGERRSWLWRIRRDGLDSHPLPGAAELDRLADSAHRLLARSRERRAADALARALQSLSDLLLGPIAGSLPAERLVIVPDGALQLVPLAALPAPSGAPSPGVPLLDLLEPVSLPSLAVLDELRRRARRQPPPAGVLAVVVDPVTDTADERLPAATTREPAAPASSPLSRPLAGDSGRVDFPRLAWAVEEAEGILALVPAGERWQARGFDASREAMLEAPLGRYRYVHFAVHVVPDERYPHLSGLVLSRFTPDGRPRDGLLRLADVFRLDLPSVDLVVLSGCRSGRGKTLRGEGIVGLTRGFMAAGAPRVAVSLWDVNDRATAELMQRFYDGLLRRGLSPAAALRDAQQAIRAEPGWSAPYYWAGFVLQGDWR